MKALIFTLAAIFPCAAQAGEAVTYTVDGETFEGYRAAASGDTKGLVLIIHDWDGLTEYEIKRADMLADMGYNAFAVDLFGKGNRPIETDARKEEIGRLTRTENVCAVLSSAASKRLATRVTREPW
jgi:dienelactone hydrolase